MKEFIKELFTFSHEGQLNESRVLNISYGVDKNFLFGAAVSMTSVLMNNKEINFAFHLFTDYIDDDYMTRFELLAKQYNTKIIIYVIDPECFLDLPTSYVWSYATYFRLLSFDYLSKTTSSVLYLDADVICKGHLDRIQEIEFSAGEYAAVIPDVDSMQYPSSQRLKWPDVEGKYFNAGVIYINLKKWHDENLTELSLKLLRGESEYGFLKYLDQDVLNIIFKMQNVYLPRDYNCIYAIKNELKARNPEQYREVIKESVILIHYTGATKPWHYWAEYPSAGFFLKAWKSSPWKDCALKRADKMVEFKKRYKHEFKQKKFIRSLVSCIQYNNMKRKKGRNSNHD